MTSVVEVPRYDQIIDTLSNDMKELITIAKHNYMNILHNDYGKHHAKSAFIVSAPGRVNIIGEHTDYTGGYVLPMAVQYSTVAYGTGHFHMSSSNSPSQIKFHIISDMGGKDNLIVHSRTITCSFDDEDLQPPETPAEGVSTPWTNYVWGVIVQYAPDLPKQGCILDIAISYSSNVPLGAGLSSSASLEIATSLFLECFLNDIAYSSSSDTRDPKLLRALRCQRAENLWAFSPCGIMDQMASSLCVKNSCLLVDCKDMITTQIPMKIDMDDDDTPVFVIANSGVTHSIHVDAEYGKRRKECYDAVDGIQSVPLYHVECLRDANVKDVQEAYDKNKLDDILYKRAMHVVTENKRVLECKTAMKLGLYDKIGTLMYASQDSMRNNFEVSCPEIDKMIDITKEFNNEMITKLSTDTNTVTGMIYGSRLTGGGFGGCIVTFMKKQYANEYITYLQSKYKESYPNMNNNKCTCFITLPSDGARIIATELL